MTDEEEVLDIHDIQGHVYPGFGSAYSAVVALRLDQPDAGRIAAGKLVPEVTSTAAAMRDKNARRTAFAAKQPFPSQPVPSLALAFTSEAFESWGRSSTRTDLSFREGMLRDAEALGDPLDEDRVPLDWIFAKDDVSRVDMLLIAGHSSFKALNTSVKRWLNTLTLGWTVVQKDYGRRRSEDKEFFGFNDGISQPAIRGLTPDSEPLSKRVIVPEDSRSREFARPGQRLVWPGNFIFGYAREVSGPLEPGSQMTPPESWMRNGSYLVYRRLSQKVEHFRNAIAKLEAHLLTEGEVPQEDWIAARLVGRWENGSPLTIAPNAPDATVGADPNRHNHFNYQSTDAEITVLAPDATRRDIPATPADPRGRRAPVMSHIRQVNPREGRSEIGPEHHPSKLMLRRGIAFGPEFDDDPGADRGLIFLSYQTSIVEQFKFVQVTWANSEELPRPKGRDPIIGQDGTTDTQRSLSFHGPSGRELKCPMNGRWVIPTGGAYLFAPSIEGLRELTGLNFPAKKEESITIDELRRIRGIGPKSATKLMENGITALAQVADWTDLEIAQFDKKLKFHGRITRDDWVGQAKQLLRDA